MDVVIPAKACSTRVRNKNYREFFGGASLVDITIHRVLEAGISNSRIHLSCEDSSKREVAEKHSINFISRDVSLASNHTPITEVIRGVCSQIAGDDPVMWAQCCDPFFDLHRQCIDSWRSIAGTGEHDSVVACRETRGYFLDQHHLPIQGWGFGPWHRISQHLPSFYKLPFTCSILTRRSIQEVGYYVGATPLWVSGTWTEIDIDTEEDFAIAQLMAERKHRGNPCEVF